MNDRTTVVDGRRFPEGPVAIPNGSIVLVEIAARRITRVIPGGGRQIVATSGSGPNG